MPPKFGGRYPVLLLLISLLSLTHTSLGKLPEPDWDLPDCEEGRLWDNLGPEKSRYWGESLAELYARDYINNNTDHTFWAQRLYMDLFGETQHHTMSCVTAEANCFFTAKCSDFNNIKKGGLYYLFVSMHNFHTYMKGMEEQLQEAAILTDLTKGSYKENLGLEGGEKGGDPSKEYAAHALNTYAAALTWGAGITALIPGGAPVAAVMAIWAGLVTATSAIVSISNVEHKFEKLNDNVIIEIMKKVESNQFAAVNRILGGVFGLQGQSQQETIPKVMWLGGEHVQHPAVRVFGHGSWLMDHPTASLGSETFKEAGKKLEQGIVWSLVRDEMRGTVIIRDDKKSAGDCAEPMNAWDEENQRCYDLMQASDQGLIGFKGDAKVNGFWEAYGMDKMHTMRNSVECFEKHDGKTVQTHLPPFQDTSIPPCFFPQLVHKGTWHKAKYLQLDQSYKGQQGHDKWPHMQLRIPS